jgi:predicted GNAT family acetyltransferase
MSAPTQIDLLDNVPWHAIDGPQSALADRTGRAGRFHLDVAPFSAIADDSTDSWHDLAALAGPGKPAVLFTPGVVTPNDWHEDLRFACYQMVATDVTQRPAHELITLGPQDVPEMIELVQATQPGPFSERTIEMGRYCGYRDDGRLVAMAGERLRCDGFAEVSAVCTAEDQRGKGLGASLTLAVVHHVRERGDEAFLHVRTNNTPAYNLYLVLGFTVRAEVEALILRAPGER